MQQANVEGKKLSSMQKHVAEADEEPLDQRLILPFSPFDCSDGSA